MKSIEDFTLDNDEFVFQLDFFGGYWVCHRPTGKTLWWADTRGFWAASIDERKLAIQALRNKLLCNENN